MKNKPTHKRIKKPKQIISVVSDKLSNKVSNRISNRFANQIDVFDLIEQEKKLYEERFSLILDSANNFINASNDDNLYNVYN